MIYQLPNGKSIELSTEQYLKMSDQELRNLIAADAGEEFNDPFIYSVLRHGPSNTELEDLENDFNEDELECLTDINPEDKMFDDDFIDYDNLEQ